MSLDIKKIYVDSRYKTSNSNSDSDFSIELPRSFNVPDGVVAHIDDIVIPVCWTTVDERNPNCYFAVFTGVDSDELSFTMPSKNYDGIEFATALAQQFNEAIATYKYAKPVVSTTYDLMQNILVISLSDSRSASAKTQSPVTLQIRTDEVLQNPPAGSDITQRSNPRTINAILRTTVNTRITETTPWRCFLDLHPTRNSYLCSAALASYDTVSNFGNDNIIKQIPCAAGFNKLLVQMSGSTLDGLSVSRRSLRYIDFKLVDTSNNIVPLQGNHFSFSIVFVKK